MQLTVQAKLFDLTSPINQLIELLDLIPDRLGHGLAFKLHGLCLIFMQGNNLLLVHLRRQQIQPLRLSQEVIY